MFYPQGDVCPGGQIYQLEYKKEVEYAHTPAVGCRLNKDPVSENSRPEHTVILMPVGHFVRPAEAYGTDFGSLLAAAPFGGRCA